MNLIEFYKTKKTLAEKQRINIQIISDSMHPLLPIGSCPQVEFIKPENLNKFDVIVFWESEKLIGHFLWSKQFNQRGNAVYITKSLKNPLSIDLPLKEELILGKINVKIPLLTKLKIILQNR